MSSSNPPTALTCAAALAIGLSACGGGSGDKDQIDAIIKDVGKNPSALCSKYATSSLLAQTGGEAACLKAASAANAVDPNVKINSVSVNGSSATANVTGKTGSNTISFTKVNGKWMVTGAH